MSSSVIMTYTVHPPEGTTLPKDVPTSKTLEIPVNGSVEIGNGPASGKSSAYYKALHDALADARNKIGEDLTTWRDAVGKLELNKETKRGVKAEDEDEEEEEEEEND
ncbi:hypothetical protein GYMLUDRAFT_94352 [Collybiopsis luxurians FD-317 M1]|nr:hypothetical protein GYMLUDRAFT_94352 [Collybiopsis luxurians FD-317 M1]